MTSAETRAAFAKHIFNDEGVRVEWHGGEPGHESFGVWVSLSHGWFVWQAAYAAGVDAGLEEGEEIVGERRVSILHLDATTQGAVDALVDCYEAIRAKRKEQQGG